MQCDLKTSSQAWNDGIDAFKKAFKLSGGKTTNSIKFALSEVQKLHPDLDFSQDSFVNPLVKSLKEKGVIDNKYEFSTQKKSERVNVSEKKVTEIIDKAKGLDENQKKTFAKKVYEQLNEKEMLSRDDIQSMYSEAIGLPSMDEKMRGLVKTVAQNNKALDTVNKKIKTLLGEAQTEKASNEDKKLTPERDKHFETEINKLNEEKKKAESAARDSSSKLADRLQEKGFWLKDISDMARMNLMNPVSLLKNFTGALFDGSMRQASNATSSIMSEILYRVFNQKKTNPILARTKGALATKRWQSVKEAWKYGAIDKAKTELPSGSSLNSANEFRRAMDATGFNKLKHYVAGAFKYSPERIAKTLAATDAIFYDMAYNAELERSAGEQGLKGFDKAAFVENPDEKSRELAKAYADKVTFRQDLPFGLKTSFNFEAGKKKLIEKGYSPTSASYISGLTYMATTLVFPFIKTPVNIVRNAVTIMMPELAISKGIFDAYAVKDNATERQRILTEAAAKAVTGMVIRSVAIEMIAAGLISAGYSDEDEKTKDVIEQQAGGPNRINVNALMRGLTFGDIKAEKGDKYVDLSSLGVLGIVFGAYAHAYTKFSKEDLDKERDIIKNEFSILPRVAGGILGSAMDQTFFTGINELQRAVKEIDGGGMSKYVVNNMMTLIGSIIPSTMQKFSTSVDPFVYKQFDKDKDFGENLSNALGYRFAGSTGTMDKKYFSLTEDKNSATKKKDYLLLDDYLGRVLQQELDVFKAFTGKEDNPITRLYEATRDVKMKERANLLPSSVGLKQNFEGINLAMNKEQYTYLTDRAAIQRTLRATPYIMSEDFKKSTYEERVDVLKSFYKDGLEAAKEDLISKYPQLLEGNQEESDNTENRKDELIEKYQVEE
jgi:hypothetical protein